ncbi:alpha-amylase family glycosyl hydrolase [Ruminococcus sp.]|uniref:alpha-amylase family glycosyl hydrolase n=1 Tax=Ruminococcus sp. TaxID=41978 RepID=UPI00261137EA|nr:alpha-amylase family glycosyl hydrolase [Ruminococcus sp.]MDD6989247.1 alpha-amylase family glycosyl hydrolase [Ruminococcus sp.]MDY6202102.1 alpha-amylase family glycosyl hydrolase [Ruminococcus sp.]
MKALRKVVSLAIAATMITSSFAFTASVSAAETTDASVSSVSSDSAIQSEVKDGVMLHAFNWSYNTIKENLPAIAAAGYTTVQTSPVQQAKDYGTSNDVAGQWWKLYQPVSMSIAQKSWLGTKEDLKSLCAEADKYGIKIICDIVSNHMGNEVESDPNSLSEQVKTYQPDFYTNKSSYFHSFTGSASDGSIQSVVQGHVSACPDLNTGNTNVQNAVISLLKECIDCGVDGFRFDAAKHIETPDDGSYASNYWPNITSAAESYYKNKTGGNLYIYGEILNTCGSGRSYGSYTKYINVTDNRTGDAVLAAVSKGNASTAANSSYKSGVSASNAVLWAESHDTYEGESGSAGIANTAGISDEDVIKAWAIVASRKDSTALYFARPGAALMGEAATDTAYKSTAVSEVNKFHNLFVGQSEKLGSSDGVAYVARGTSGIVLANCTGTTKSVSISGTGIADGSYVDTITGNKFTVSGGVLTGSIGSTGVAVVYSGTTTPKNTCSVESGTFTGETMTVELGLENATSGTYCLDDSTPVTYTGKTTIRIGSDYKYGETINLTLTATDGTKTTTTTYKYTKQEAASSGVYIFFDTAKFTSWKAPFNIYIYDEDTSSTTTYKNASWPGQAMKLDPATGYYYVEVSSKSCIAEDKTTKEASESNYDLAHSSNTYVIISDSNGNQHPSDGARTKRSLGGSSKILTSTATAGWASTTLVPSTGTPVEATDVTKGTVATVPTTTAPVPTTSAPAPTTTPVGTMIYGDVNGDGYVTVADATLIQKHSAGLTSIADEYLVLGDVNDDGVINVIDATMIQKYIVGDANWGLTGQPYAPATEPDTTVATEPETTVTQPETTVTEPEPTATVVTEPETTNPPLSKDYYLFGYINGANYGCEEDYENLGDYKFVDGKVTVNFDQTSYVGVKTPDNEWFMTDDWQGAVTEVTLYNTKDLGTTANKLMVPAGESVLTLVENADGTLTLSYELISEPVTTPTEATEETVATEPETTNPPLSKDYYLFGFINGANYGVEEDYENLGDYKFVDGKVTVNFNQTSYVGVKTPDNEWFMTDDWQGAVTEVTLYNAKDLGVTANKLMVPAGESVLTLVENADGTLTLSYELISEPVTTPTEATEETVATEPTTAPSADTYTFYFKTTLGWMTDDGVTLFVYDNSTGESYVLEKDENAYPNVYTAEVPETMTSCVIYRYLEAVYETPVAGDTGNVYNCWSAKVSKTNNCVTLSNDEQVSVGPYVAEEKPAFELSRVYFDNSKTKWSEVYIYGWAESGLGNAAVAMTKIEGTNIWYYDFATPLSPGAKCFLFKDTESTWNNQTNDIVVTKDMNCYLANAGSKTGGSWYYYTEK